MRVVEVELPLDLFTDVHWQWEVRLTEITFDNLVTLFFECSDIRPHLERVFGVDTGCPV
jgi:hypothetical protein